MILPRPHIAKLAPYALADRGAPTSISLSQNESAFPASPRALAAGRAALDEVGLYPDPDWTDLRTALEAAYDVSAANIVCGAGSMELIACLLECYAGPGADVLGTEFGYLYVASVAAQIQARHVTVTEPDLTVSTDNLLRALSPDTKLVFVCNPGNPTGTLIPNAQIVKLRDQLPDDVMLVVDQAYGEFSDELEPPGEIFALVERGNTCVLRTLSKAYGLAGQRLGWGLFPPDVGREMRKILRPGGVTGVSLAMGQAAVEDVVYMRGVVQNTSLVRDQFAARCIDLGIAVPASHTNFVLLPFATEKVCRHVANHLQDKGFIGRAMSGYGLPNAYRITIAAQDIMDKVADHLKEALQ